TNLPISEEVYRNMLAKVKSYVEDKDLYVVKAKAGASENHAMNITVYCENAAQAVFASQIFIKDQDREGYDADFTVVALPNLKANGKEDGVNSEAFIIINFTDRVVLIGGTKYSGEINKSIFS